MYMNKRLYLSLLIAPLFLASCDKMIPAEPYEDELLDGPIEGLTYAENQRFVAGDVAFNDEIFTVEKGLGPLFNAVSCVSCHAGDGKGTHFSSLIRFGQTDSTGNKFLDQGGPQIQSKAIPGYEPETLPAGATYTKLVPTAVTGLGYLQYVTDADLLAMADPHDSNNDGISGRVNWKKLDDYLKERR